MQPKALATFIPYLANVFYTLLEICALELYENQSIIKRVLAENRLIRKEKLNMTSKVLKLPFII